MVFSNFKQSIILFSMILLKIRQIKIFLLYQSIRLI